MANNRLVAIGEALFDMIPDKTGCAFYEVTGFSPKLGGAPANVCGAYARLGGDARLITQLGIDPFGDKLLRELGAYGIDTSCIATTDQANTALAFVSLATDGNRTFSFYRNPSADMLLSQEQVKADWFDGLFALHFCSVSLGNFPMKGAHRKAIALAQEAGGIISFDPNLRFQLWHDPEQLKQTVWEFLPLSDIVKISDEELSFLTGETHIESALPRLFTGNVKLVIYTCGGKGAYAFTRTQAVFSPAEKVSVRDTTGAGDGFIGSLLWMLMHQGITRETLGTLDAAVLQKSIDFSNAFCTYSVQRLGAIPSYPTQAELAWNIKA